MAKNDNLTTFLTDVANAIRTKKGTTDLINPQDFSSEIASIEGSGGDETIGAVVSNDVNFYDYDGTLLYSYTKSEFLALSDLPELPTSEGLICQGWNYTLAKAKEYVTSYGVLNIGATYITNDGKTRLYIRIAAPGRMNVPLYFNQSAANGVTIDWGDGSPSQTLSGTGNKNTTHTYANIGDYVITLTVTSGTLGLGSNSLSYCIMGPANNTGRVYCNMLQKVEIGEGVTSIGRYDFNYCHSLSSIIIPDGVTSIGVNAFNYCYSLSSIIIPESVTSIGSYAFSYCYGMAFYDFRSAKSVPTISSNIFNNNSSDRKIIVPDSLYDSWIAATNWSTYASYIIKTSDYEAL